MFSTCCHHASMTRLKKVLKNVLIFDTFGFMMALCSLALSKSLIFRYMCALFCRTRFQHVQKYKKIIPATDPNSVCCILLAFSCRTRIQHKLWAALSCSSLLLAAPGCSWLLLAAHGCSGFLWGWLKSKMMIFM